MPRCVNSIACMRRCAQSSPARNGLFSRLFGNDAPDAPRGLYLWGGVGRGKTFLIDLFYDGLPLAEKRRTHFHRFMRQVHDRLRAHAGQRDPLAAIAKEWRETLRVLVLDEFFVSDIGDAMLLGRLLDRLFAEGVVLVTSSNAAPGELYKDGLQRARFLPAIALIERHCAVVHLDSPARLPPARAHAIAGVPRAARWRIRRVVAGALGHAEPRLPARGWPVHRRRPRDPRACARRRHGVVRFRRVVRRAARDGGLHRTRRGMPHGAAGRHPVLRRHARRCARGVSCTWSTSCTTTTSTWCAPPMPRPSRCTRATGSRRHSSAPRPA
jgi:hypothetical protein